jgi:hypothetical protein
MNDFEIYRYASQINDDVDNFSSVITYTFTHMTLMELMDTLKEIFERFPFSRNYTIHLQTFNTNRTASVVQIDKERAIIRIY